MPDSPGDVALQLAAWLLFSAILEAQQGINGPEGIYVAMILWGVARMFCHIIPSS